MTSIPLLRGRVLSYSPWASLDTASRVLRDLPVLLYGAQDRQTPLAAHAHHIPLPA